MTHRERIIREVHGRLKRWGESRVGVVLLYVAEDVATHSGPGEIVVNLMPGADGMLDEGEYGPAYREALIAVQVARARKPSEDGLEAWVKVEELIPQVRRAVEVAYGAPDDQPDDLAGALMGPMDFVELAPVEKPVGGTAYGVQLVWRMRYSEPEGSLE